jgi:hypothetical protein
MFNIGDIVQIRFDDRIGEIVEIKDIAGDDYYYVRLLNDDVHSFMKDELKEVRKEST